MFGYFSEITEPAKSIYQNNSIKQTDSYRERGRGSRREEE